MAEREHRELNKHWLGKLLSGRPHLVIGGEDNPYLIRRFLIPRNRLLNIYLHKFVRSDDDRALHDHPWWFVSLVLKGGYWEHRGGRLIGVKSWRAPGSLAFRRPGELHRVELERTLEYASPGTVWFEPYVHERPCWTLVVTGPRMRSWGFQCPRQGWVHWRRFEYRNGCGA